MAMALYGSRASSSKPIQIPRQDVIHSEFCSNSQQEPPKSLEFSDKSPRDHKLKQVVINHVIVTTSFNIPSSVLSQNGRLPHERM